MKKIGIYGGIYPNSENSEKAVHKFLDTLEPNEDFEVYINSPGGSVFVGISIYNLLAERRPQPVVKIIGEAASIASVISMAGREIWIAESAIMLVHKPWVIAIGDEDLFKKAAIDLKTLKENLWTIYETRTNMKRPELEKLMKEDRYMKANEVVEKKLADKIWKPSEDEKNVSNARMEAFYRSCYGNSSKAFMNYYVEKNIDPCYSPKDKKNNEVTSNEITKYEPILRNYFMIDKTQASVAFAEWKEKFPAAVSDFNKVQEFLDFQLNEVERLNKELETQNLQIKEKETEVAAKDKEIEEAKDKIAEIEEEKNIAEIDAFLAENSKRIKPNEKDNVKTKLVAYMKAGNTVMIGNDTAYENYKKEIAGQKEIVLDKGIDTKEPKPGTFNIDSVTMQQIHSDDNIRKGFADYVKAEAAKNNRPYKEQEEIVLSIIEARGE